MAVTRDENANGVHYRKNSSSRGECKYTDLHALCVT